RGVAAVSANELWAVGDYTIGAYHRTLVEHWEGTHWTIVPSPNADADSSYLTAVAAVSANDVWAVGYYSNYPYLYSSALIEHWDGIRWTIVPSPDAGGPLNGIAAVSASDVWAMGN